MTSAPTPVRVLLADDQELVRHGFAALIEAEPDLTVVGQATSGAEAIDLAYLTRPDVVLMDIRMPRLDGIAATQRITSDQRLAEVRILVLTTFGTDEYIYGALRAGASGFLLKDTGPAQLLDGIRIVADGGALIAPTITKRLIEEFAARPDPNRTAAQLDRLTERELDVLVHVAQGLSNAEIADALIISPLTAKTHVSSILSKVGARDRAQLVVVAYETVSSHQGKIAGRAELCAADAHRRGALNPSGESMRAERVTEAPEHTMHRRDRPPDRLPSHFGAGSRRVAI